MSTERFTVDSLAISIQFKKPFPFDERLFLTKLKEKGFIQPKEGQKVITAGPEGRQMPGLRWVKEKLTLIYSPEAGSLILDGSDTKGVAVGFDEIVPLVEGLMDADVKIFSSWTELILEGRYRSDKKPFATLGKLFPENISADIDKIVGVKLKNMDLRLYSTDRTEIDDPLYRIPNWFDIMIMPFAPNPAYYLVRIVNRSEEPRKISRFCENSETMIESIIHGLEEKSG